jgi:hypothetical protein
MGQRRIESLVSAMASCSHPVLVGCPEMRVEYSDQLRQWRQIKWGVIRLSHMGTASSAGSKQMLQSEAGEAGEAGAAGDAVLAVEAGGLSAWRASRASRLRFFPMTVAAAGVADIDAAQKMNGQK